MSRLASQRRRNGAALTSARVGRGDSRALSVRGVSQGARRSRPTAQQLREREAGALAAHTDWALCAFRGQRSRCLRCVRARAVRRSPPARCASRRPASRRCARAPHCAHRGRLRIAEPLSRRAETPRCHAGACPARCATPCVASRAVAALRPADTPRSTTHGQTMPARRLAPPPAPARARRAASPRAGSGTRRSSTSGRRSAPLSAASCLALCRRRRARFCRGGERC